MREFENSTFTQKVVTKEPATIQLVMINDEAVQPRQVDNQHLRRY